MKKLFVAMLFSITSTAVIASTCIDIKRDIEAYDALLNGTLISKDFELQNKVQNWKFIAEKQLAICLADEVESINKGNK